MTCLHKYVAFVQKTNESFNCKNITSIKRNYKITFYSYRISFEETKLN